MFDENVFPNTQNLVNEVQDMLNKWILDEGKLNMFKSEIIGLIDDFDLNDFYTYDVMKNVGSKGLMSIKDEYDKLRKKTNRKIEDLSKKKNKLSTTYVEQIDEIKKFIDYSEAIINTKKDSYLSHIEKVGNRERQKLNDVQRLKRLICNKKNELIGNK